MRKSRATSTSDEIKYPKWSKDGKSEQLPETNQASHTPKRNSKTFTIRSHRAVSSKYFTADVAAPVVKHLTEFSKLKTMSYCIAKALRVRRVELRSTYRKVGAMNPPTGRRPVTDHLISAWPQSSSRVKVAYRYQNLI